MTDYFVGKGGSDAANGLTWANRKLTLTGAESVPVAAGDTVYVGPGVYREELECIPNGTSGSPITYVGDPTGYNTDGIGGEVRWSASDDDLTITRARCIDLNIDDWRTFRGFTFDGGTNAAIEIDDSTDCIVEDCVFSSNSALDGIYANGNSLADITIRRCLFIGLPERPIRWSNASSNDNGSHLVENCLFVSCKEDNISITRIGTLLIKNCTFIGAVSDAIDVVTAPTTGITTVNNCIFEACTNALEAEGVGDLVEDYNDFYNNGSDRVNVSVGSNSVAVMPLFNLPFLFDGIKMPSSFLGELQAVSSLARKTGTSPSADDIFGMSRPATGSKISWGAVQLETALRETTTVDDGSVSLRIEDAGRVQFLVPTTAVSTTISVKVYRETNYAGTLPQMVIKQPGQADRTTTDVGSASAWNTLTDTFTPSGTTDFVVVELVSNNTATSGNYDVFFDTINVN